MSPDVPRRFAALLDNHKDLQGLNSVWEGAGGFTLDVEEEKYIEVWRNALGDEFEGHPIEYGVVPLEIYEGLT